MANHSEGCFYLILIGGLPEKGSVEGKFVLLKKEFDRASAHACNPSTQEAEARRVLEQHLGVPGL
jgi:hypothetical protein